MQSESILYVWGGNNCILQFKLIMKGNWVLAKIEDKLNFTNCRKFVNTK